MVPICQDWAGALSLSTDSALKFLHTVCLSSKPTGGVLGPAVEKKLSARARKTEGRPRGWIMFAHIQYLPIKGNRVERVQITQISCNEVFFVRV
jgi:hypothetical protein